MELREKVLSGLRWSAGARFLSQAATWAITLMVMRLLAPGDYGLMALAGFFVNLLGLLNELGLGAALIQKESLEERALRQIFGLVLVVNCVLFGILFSVAPLIARFFQEPRILSIIQVLSAQFLVMSWGVIPQSLLDREMSFRNKSIIDFISAIAGALATLFLAMIGWGVWSLVWGSLAVTVTRSIGFNLISGYLLWPLFSFKGMAQMICFGGYVTVGRVLWFFFTQADIFIVGKLMGRELLGFYSVANHLASLPMEKLSGIINQVAFPAFSSLQTEPQKAASHFLKSVRIMSFFAFPSLWGISCLAPEIVDVLLGAQWNPAALPFQLLALVIPFRMVANLVAPAVMGLGRPDISFWNTLISSMVMPLSILIGARWGILGVSLAWVVIFPLLFFQYLLRAVPLFGIKVRDVLSAMLRPVLMGAAMYSFLLGIKIFIRPEAHSLWHLILLITAGVGVYGGMMVRGNRQGYREVLGLVLGRSA